MPRKKSLGMTMICIALAVVCQSSVNSHAEQPVIANDTTIQPVKIDYSSLAFYPERWKKAEASFDMLAWEGKQVVFVTKRGNYQPEELTKFVGRLDHAWQKFSDLIGETPKPLKTFHDKPVICAIPKSNLSCGYGCGMVGATGIEASAFYSIDLPNFRKSPDSFQHYYFYEMGRNFYVFGDRHSSFRTGFAVFMRYVCMDGLGCKDLDIKTRRTIERCEEEYAKSDVSFYDAFLRLDSDEKQHRLADRSGRTIVPSDQPVMYATAMLKLRRDYGGDAWVQRFYRALLQSNSAVATDIESAKVQLLNWLVCASVAAQKDLTPVFADRWRMPLTQNQRQVMLQTDWKDENIDIKQVVSNLLAKR